MKPRRFFFLLRIFLTGITPPLTDGDITTMRAAWNALDPDGRVELYQDMREANRGRRLSMTGNAEKGGLLFGAMAFGVVIAVALFTTELSPIVLMLGVAALLCMILSAAVIAEMISPKRKLLKQEVARVPTGVRRAQRAADDLARSQSGDFKRGWLQYLESAQTQEKRDWLTYVERLALRFACKLFIVGLLLMATAIVAATI